MSKSNDADSWLDFIEERLRAELFEEVMK